MEDLFGGNEIIDADKLLGSAGVVAGTKVADLGCGGSGHFVFSASDIVGSEGVVYAVDILRLVLERIKARARLENRLNIQIIWSNLEVFGATAIETASLDVGLLINTLFQSAKKREMMEESIRLLKPSGRLVIVDWQASVAPFGPPKEKRVDAQEMKNLVRELGFMMITDFIPGPYHFGFIATK